MWSVLKGWKIVRIISVSSSKLIVSVWWIYDGIKLLKVVIFRLLCEHNHTISPFIRWVVTSHNLRSFINVGKVRQNRKINSLWKMGLSKKINSSFFSPFISRGFSVNTSNYFFPPENGLNCPPSHVYQKSTYVRSFTEKFYNAAPPPETAKRAPWKTRITAATTSL